MQIGKRIVVGALLAGTLSCCCGFSAAAAWSYDSGTKVLSDGNWVLNVSTSNDSKRGITGGFVLQSCTSGSGDLDLAGADEALGGPLYYVANNVFKQNAAITSFAGPSVLCLGSSVFNEASSITNIELNADVDSFGTQAFRYCTSLVRLAPQTMTKVTQAGDGAFTGCSKLAQPFDFPNLKQISGSYFASGAGFTSFNAPKLEIVGTWAFSNCPMTGDLDLPVLTNAASSAFNGTAFSSASVPKLTSAQNFFQGCTNLVSAIISDRIENMSSMFRDCKKLRSVTPLKLRKVANLSYAFNNCAELTGPIVINSPDLSVIHGYAFAGCTALTNVTFQSAVTTVHANGFSGSTNLHLYFAQENPPTSISWDEWNSSFPKSQTSHFHVRHIDNTAWAEWLEKNAYSDENGPPKCTYYSGSYRQYRDANWNPATAPERAVGMVYVGGFGFRYVYPWPAPGLSVILR